ncbi:hypothetical protein BDD12DRAFT_910888 [Trichophaea hybrida]|nr:hypothetical protein BDD12DRAFT_910888 [Trichophaea hybrida]
MKDIPCSHRLPSTSTMNTPHQQRQTMRIPLQKHEWYDVLAIIAHTPFGLFPYPPIALLVTPDTTVKDLVDDIRTQVENLLSIDLQETISLDCRKFILRAVPTQCEDDEEEVTMQLTAEVQDARQRGTILAYRGPVHRRLIGKTLIVMLLDVDM